MRRTSIRVASAALALGLVAPAQPALADHVSHGDLVGRTFSCPTGSLKVGDDTLTVFTVKVLSKTRYQLPTYGKGDYGWAAAADKINFKNGPLEPYRLIGDGSTAEWKMRKDSNNKKVADCLLLYVPG